MISKGVACLVLYLIGLQLSYGFVSQGSTQNARILSMTAFTMSSKSRGSNIVIIGSAGGVAESLAAKLVDSNEKINLILDRQPISPLLQSTKSNINVYFGEDTNSIRSISGVTNIPDVLRKNNNNKVIIINDDGNEVLRNEKRDRNYVNKNNVNLENVLKILNPSLVSSVICLSEVEKEGNSNFFGKKGLINSYKDWCNKNSIKFSSLQYGKLIGGIAGVKLLPFLGLPALEPELDPSYTLNSVVLTSPNANQYGDIEVCTRHSLAEACYRLLEKNQFVDGLIISIPGNAPSDKDWDQLFARFNTNSNSEILKLDFKELIKPALFVSWLTDTWFPQALIDADTATILTGARPVRIVKSSETSVKIFWESLQPDLTVKVPGALEIRLLTSPPSLSVVRQASGELPGEILLVDRLIEGINKFIYKKNIAVPM